MNIYEKISAIMQDVQYLAKDDHVEFGSTKYKALSEEKVTTIMRAELLKYRLIVFPVEQQTGRNGNITHVDVKYRIVDVENPADFIEVTSCGDGADTQDKGSGKAMTYSYKYMWLRTFALPTGEDPDKISSAELDAKEKEAQNTPLCSRCNQEIKAARKRDGSMWDAANIAKYSQRRYNAVFCPSCMKAVDAENGNGG